MEKVVDVAGFTGDEAATVAGADIGAAGPASEDHGGHEKPTDQAESVLVSAQPNALLYVARSIILQRAIRSKCG